MMEDSGNDVQMLQYLTNCLNNFKKKIQCLILINQEGPYRNSHSLDLSLNSISEEGAQLIRGLKKFTDQMARMENIFPRFIARAKEIVNTSKISLTCPEISNYLRFLSSLLKESLARHQLTFLLKYMLLKLPKGFITPHISQEDDNLLIFPQKTLSREWVPIRSMNLTCKPDVSNDNYEKMLVCLQAEYVLLMPLGLDEADLRKKFFLARQDHHRKDNNLYEDMMARNRVSQQMSLVYLSDYEKFSKKMVGRRRREISSPQKALSNAKKEMGSFTTKGMGNRILTEKGASSNFLNTQFKRAERIKTGHPSYIDTAQEEPGAGPKKRENSFSIPNRTRKLKTQITTCPSSGEFLFSSNLIEAERQKLTKNNGNLIELKKINFVGSRIELLPESYEEFHRVHKADKKKEPAKRAEDILRKKISVLSQTKANSQPYIYCQPKVRKYHPLIVDNCHSRG